MISSLKDSDFLWMWLAIMDFSTETGKEKKQTWQQKWQLQPVENPIHLR